MAASIFDDKAKLPTRPELDQALGNSAILLKAIEEDLTGRFGEEPTREWKFYGKKAGWTLAFGHQGRRIFHLIPQAGCFTVVFILGQRAVVACQALDLPAEIRAEIVNGRVYAEGMSIRLVVQAMEDVHNVQQLTAIKLS